VAVEDGIESDAAGCGGGPNRGPIVSVKLSLDGGAISACLLGETRDLAKPNLVVV
jgi:hypothetical protein